MMALANNNMMHIAVSNEQHNVSNSQETSSALSHTQGQFPTYGAVTCTQSSRVSQVLTSTEKLDLALNIDSAKPPPKTSIISVVKGTGSGNQKILIQKSPNDSSGEGHSRKALNNTSLIHPRTPSEETANVHYVRKNAVPSRELQNESPNNNNNNAPSESHVIHHGGNSMAASFSPNMSMNNQPQGPPSYMDATSYTHREISHSSFQRQSPFEMHEPYRPAMHQQNDKKSQLEGHESSRFHQHGSKNHQVLDLSRTSLQQSDKKNLQRHEGSRPPHQQGDKKVHVVLESPGPIEQQGEHQHKQLHPTNRTMHQQGDKKGQVYESSRPVYQHEQKTPQKHDVMRTMQQRESNRVIQLDEHKGQQLREPIYHHGEQKGQKIHYQLSDQKNQQMHLPSRPMYLHADQQKSPKIYETGRQMHQPGEQKGQQVHESPRSYQHNEQKKHHQHESSRMMHQANDQNNQQVHDSPHQHGHHPADQQKKHDSPRTSDQKSQQKNVHKFHHGNARVKYVEFKPIQEGMKYRQMMHHSQHPYNPNLKQTVYYSNHVPNNPNNHHLTVQTQSHSPLSPLHSPPALRPPPTLPSGTAWHSPPSLVPSPEVRPRFDFISSPQPVTTAGSPHPVQVANMVHHKAYSGGGGKGNKQISVPASHNILLPRLPGSYLGSPGHQTSHANIAHVNVVPRSKASFNQTPSSNSPGGQPVYDNSQMTLSQSGIPVSSVATTVTVTMTYIPIPTSTKDKFVYQFVNSGQPVLLYQNQQPNGKPVILPQQVMHAGRNVPNSKDNSKDQSYTTVRLQGLVNCGKGMNSSTGVASSQGSPMKSLKYHYANTPMSHGHNQSSKKSHGFVKLDQKAAPLNMNLIDLDKEKYNLTPISTKDMIILDGKQQKEECKSLMADNKSQADVMTLINNNQLKLVPSQVGVNCQPTSSGIKRNSMGVPVSSNNEFTVQSPTSTCNKSSNEESTIRIPNDIPPSVLSNDKDKKKRGRPPTEKIPRKGRKREKGKSKLSPMQINLLSVFAAGRPNTNEALIEAYRKQQQILLQKHYFEEPLLSLPDLPPTPESWTCEHIHRYLLSTDCAIYADAIKEEEIDGKSFLLLTREALMDFLGIKLGPSLKIAGHIASLRSRQRIYCLTMQQQEQQSSNPPKEKKVNLTSKVKQSETKDTAVVVSEDTSVTSITSSSSANEDGVMPSTVASNVPTTELIIPNISILSSPPEEKKIKPVIEPLLVTERSPVILKVPNPLSLILGDSSSAKPIETIEINGETPDELHVEEKGSTNLPVCEEVGGNTDIQSSAADSLHVNTQDMTNNMFEISSKPLPPSSTQMHTLTEIEPDTHENS